MMEVQFIAANVIVGLAALAAAVGIIRRLTGKQSAPACPGCRAAGGCPLLERSGKKP
jgi:hypothetical protein